MKVKFISSLRAVVAVLCSGRLSYLLTLRRPALWGRKAAKPDFAEDQGRYFRQIACFVKPWPKRTPSRSLGLEVDLGRETAARAAQCLTILPPFGACGRDVSPHDGGVEHLNQVGRLAHRREGVEDGFEHPGLAQAPKALPH